VFGFKYEQSQSVKADAVRRLYTAPGFSMLRALLRAPTAGPNVALPRFGRVRNQSLCSVFVYSGYPRFIASGIIGAGAWH